MEQVNPRKRAVKLATEGAFHTYLMVEAARRFRETLDATAFQPPMVTVLSNYTAGAHDPEPNAIRTRLFFQLFSPVNWVGCLTTAMQQGVTHVIEFGGGIGTGEGPADKRPNLESIVRKTLKGAGYEAAYSAAINVGSLREVAARLAP
jgi:[acyl-carrier-protein] S-malonyltransferase